MRVTSCPVILPLSQTIKVKPTPETSNVFGKGLQFSY